MRFRPWLTTTAFPPFTTVGYTKGEYLICAFIPAAVYQYVKADYGDRIVFGTDVWMRIQTRAYGGPGIAHLLN